MKINLPTTRDEGLLVEDVEKFGLNFDFGKWWELGLEHDQEAEELARLIGAIDYVYGGDAFCFKFGGDGDNGEWLIYLIEAAFMLMDARNETK